MAGNHGVRTSTSPIDTIQAKTPQPQNRDVDHQVRYEMLDRTVETIVEHAGIPVDIDGYTAYEYFWLLLK